MGRSIILLTVGIFTSLAIYAVTGFNKPAYTLTNGYTTTIEEHSVCYEVKNAGLRTIIVPTHAPSDWQAIINSPPRSVTFIAPTQAAYCCPSQCGSDCSKVCTWAN